MTRRIAVLGTVAWLATACATPTPPVRRADVRPPARARPPAAEPASQGPALLASAVEDYSGERLDAAFTNARRAYEAFAPSGDVRAASALEIIGHVHTKRKACADAATAHREALSIREKQRGPDHPLVALSLVSLAQALSCTGSDDEASTLLRRAYEITSADPSRVAQRVDVAARLSHLLQQRGEVRRAERVLRDSMAAVDAARGRTDPLYFTLFGARHAALQALGEAETAAEMWHGLPEADVCLPAPCPDPRSAARASSGSSRSSPKPADVSDLKRTVTALAPSFKACYNAGLQRDRALVGRVFLTLEIGADGSVVQAKGHRVGHLDEDTVLCLLRTASAPRFARSEASLRVPLTLIPVVPVAAGDRTAEPGKSLR